MSNQQIIEREAARTRTSTPVREGGQQVSAAADHSEDHLIRGYN